ncbi:MAG: peroxidase-related enzyme [Rhodospirillaceae bacterium]
MSRIRPLSDEELGDLAKAFEPTIKRMGFVPNSQRVMAYKPELLNAFAELGRAVNKETEGSIPAALKSMIANASSLAAGCMYCIAHTGSTTSRTGVDDETISAIWEFETSDRFTEAERAALRFAQAASAVPNMVSDADFAELRRYYTDYQIVEIVGVIAMFGFLNRWNDTMATALEEEPVEFAERALKDRGWNGGKHLATPGEAAE